MMRWEQGRPTIERRLADGHLERVPASREQADALLDKARGFARSARMLVDAEPAAGYALSYDAARMALTAVLENQGLRPTSRGGHLAVLDAVTAQLDPPLGADVRSVNRLRLRRNRLEYPVGSEPTVTPEELIEALVKVDAVIGLTSKVLDVMPPWT
jgi:hypothetical protein